MKRIALITALFFLSTVLVFAQELAPSHWWVGMKNQKLQIMVHRDRVAHEKISMTPYPGVRLVSQTKTENPNYLFLNLEISPVTKAGKLRFRIDHLQGPEAVSSLNFDFELKKRSPENGKTRVLGINSSDLTYLIMPDRFANGDPSNDDVPEYRDPKADRSSKFARHGGDLKGVENHLDYFNELGVTALWFTPVTENDMPKMGEQNHVIAGYHGYWFTDHYQVDKRFGGNEAYRSLVDAAHKKGLKIIQDAIYNHVGLYHKLVLDPPGKDWINQWPEFTPPNHREETMFDPYASKLEKKNMIDGWFTAHLPDLNLRNPLLATYLIQHAIWTVEEFGFDGFRIDTYKYCDETFVNKVNEQLKKEFPKITTFVEAWSNTVVANAYFAENNFQIPFKHNAPGAIDFPLCFAMHAAMNQPFGWTEGVNRVYMTLAQDIVYKNPLNNSIFLDNHDMDRVFSVIGEDWTKMKWGLNWLLTMRGIPQLYYGTEILMKNTRAETDADVRFDFPGGWPGDPVNKFTKEGRTERENEAFNHISKLAHFRRSSSALKTGKTMQFVIRDGLYVYFRYDDKQTVMVMTNTVDKTIKPDWKRYSERVGGFSKMKNVQTGEIISFEGFEIKPKESFVMVLMK